MKQNLVKLFVVVFLLLVQRTPLFINDTYLYDRALKSLGIKRSIAGEYETGSNVRFLYPLISKVKKVPSDTNFAGFFSVALLVNFNSPFSKISKIRPFFFLTPA